MTYTSKMQNLTFKKCSKMALRNLHKNLNLLHRISSATTKRLLYCTEEKLVTRNLDIKTSKENAIGKKYAIQTLQTLLNTRKIVALDIVNRYRKLSLTSTCVLSGNHNICKVAGIENTTLLKYPELLAQSNLQMKIDLLKNLPYNINDVAAFLLVDEEKLKSFVDKETAIGRIGQMSAMLDVPVETISEGLTSRPFLMDMALDRIKSNIKVLKEYGITTEEINRDLWVLRYATENIIQRLEFAKSNQIEKFKTWMVRCQPEAREKYIRRRTDNKEVLGNNSVAEYLSERLKCTVDEAKVLIIKQPALKHKSMKKMKEILDFLFAQGFQPYHICRVPKILFHSVETTRKRLKELEPYGRHLDSLYVLTKSQKQYRQFYDALVKASKIKT